MSVQYDKKLSEINLIEEITLPFRVFPEGEKSDALDDFFIRTSGWVSYICEVLVFSHVANEINIENTSILPQVKSPDIGGKGLPLILPNISISNSNDEISGNLIKNLYRHSLSQLVSNYEKFLNELTRDIFIRNHHLLAVDEKQLTTKEIFELGNIDKIRNVLIGKKVMDQAMSAYPKRVEQFQKIFYVGIHSKKSPVSVAELHDLIEVRNVIQHNDGHASPQYFKRMAGYGDYRLLLPLSYSTPTVDFKWLLSFAQKMLHLAEYIDIEVANKWVTTRNK
ncbi:hypothetical protein [Psychrobacter vallis]|uniref:hypothetical protein n=1 Tax=Psychrobacter vallis TaxID=248451 RepID=UPI00191A7480|nr:hypothetical protein [Psychrobacter vallis]